MFETDTEKTTIELEAKCSYCGSKAGHEFTRTSGGYGLNGGTLLKGKDESCLVKCADCYNAIIRQKAPLVNSY